jgi:Protein of unknown function (DUF5818)
MKKLIAALCAVALLAVPGVGLSSQGNAPSQPIDPTAQAPATRAPASPAPATPPTFPTTEARPDSPPPNARVYVGTILKVGNAYVLKAASEEYRLDNQRKAKHYKGRDVKITGTLDNTTNLIHIRKIDVSPAM